MTSKVKPKKHAPSRRRTEQLRAKPQSKTSATIDSLESTLGRTLATPEDTYLLAIDIAQALARAPRDQRIELIRQALVLLVASEQPLPPETP